MRKQGLRIIAVILILMFSTMTVFAASDPAVTIVNPADKIYTDNLLISVKLTKPIAIRVRVNEYVKVNSDGTTSHITETPKDYKPKEVQLVDPETFTGTGSVSYYSKQINKIKPGAYVIYVDTLGSNGDVKYTSTKYCQVAESKEKDPDKIFEEDQSNTMNFFQSILNAIFGK